MPTLFICALRPERQSPAWGLKFKAETDFPHAYTEIVLHPLDAAGTTALVDALLRIADLPDTSVPDRGRFVSNTEFKPSNLPTVMRKAYDLASKALRRD